MCQIDFSADAQHPQIVSNGSWKVAPDPTWENQSPKITSAHMEVVDKQVTKRNCKLFTGIGASKFLIKTFALLLRRDFRQTVGDWKSAYFDDSLWSNARVLQRESGWPLPQEDERPGHFVPPWTALIRRDIPDLKYGKVPFQEFLQKGFVIDEVLPDSELLNLPAIEEIEVETNSDPSDFDLPTEIPALSEDRASYILFDLNEVHNAHTYLDIEGPAGTVVDILSAPFLIVGIFSCTQQ